MENDPITHALARDLDSAFSHFVDSTQDRLYTGLRILVGGDAAQDIAQETYFKAFRALQQYPPARIRQLKLNAWLWTIAMNTTRNRRRSQARHPEIVTDRLPERPTYTPNGIDQDLLDAINSLTAHQRSAVVLHHVLAFTYGEIAEMTGRAEGTIKSDVSRALAILRTKGITP